MDKAFNVYDVTLYTHSGYITKESTCRHLNHDNEIDEAHKKRLTPNPPKNVFSMRVPRHVNDELKEIATVRGFSGYRRLIRFYVSQGMRRDIEALDAQQ